MRLSDIQKSFKNTLLDPSILDDENGTFRAIFKTDTGISLENRMKVYRNNVIRSLTDATLSALPMTKKLVGEEFLEEAARRYVVKNLPTEGNLNLYGTTFPDFIRTYEPAQAIPYLYDMTRLEWAWEKAYYAADDAALDPQKLAQLPEDDLADVGFELRRSCFLIESDHPLDIIVDFCRSEREDTIQKLPKHGVKLLAYRPLLSVEIRKITDHEYLFLETLKNGKTIHETAETILEDDPNVDISDLLQKFLGLGVFRRFTLQ